VSTRRALTIALAVQLLLIAVLWWPRDPTAGRRHPLLDVPRDRIERIAIAARPEEGEEAEPVVLAKSGAGWTIASAADFPAEQARIDELLDSLLGLVVGAPIATRSASHDTFQVGDDSYGRRIEVTADGDTRTWLVGAATSRSVHVRPADGDEVFLATGASEWSFRDTPSGYWNASYVAADAELFGALRIRNEHGEIFFEKRDEEWSLGDLAEGEVADAAKIRDLVLAAARVAMSEPVGREVRPEYGLDAGLRVDWTIPAEDQSVSAGYSVGAEVEGAAGETAGGTGGEPGGGTGGESYLKAVDHPFVVRVRSGAFQRLRDARRADFLAPAAEVGPGPDAR
jgi:hypothetical protein